MSHAHPGPVYDRDHEYDRHPALMPLVIDVIPDQTRAELEASIDESLAVERGPAGWDSENDAASNARSGANHD